LWDYFFESAALILTMKPTGNKIKIIDFVCDAGFDFFVFSFIYNLNFLNQNRIFCQCLFYFGYSDNWQREKPLFP